MPNITAEEALSFGPWQATDGDRRAIEGVVNHLHLWDLLPDTDEKDYDELWQLGELMVLGWQASLDRTFSGRAFAVTLTDDYGLTVTAVSTDT